VIVVLFQHAYKFHDLVIIFFTFFDAANGRCIVNYDIPFATDVYAASGYPK